MVKAVESHLDHRISRSPCSLRVDVCDRRIDVHVCAAMNEDLGHAEREEFGGRGVRLSIRQLVRRATQQLIHGVVAGALPKALPQIRNPGEDEHVLRPDHLT